MSREVGFLLKVGDFLICQNEVTILLCDDNHGLFYLNRKRILFMLPNKPAIQLDEKIVRFIHENKDKMSRPDLLRQANNIHFISEWTFNRYCELLNIVLLTRSEFNERTILANQGKTVKELMEILKIGRSQIISIAKKIGIQLKKEVIEKVVLPPKKVKIMPTNKPQTKPDDFRNRNSRADTTYNQTGSELVDYVRGIKTTNRDSMTAKRARIQ